MFYRTLKQLRNKKEYGMINIPDKNETSIIQEAKIMEIRREYFQELIIN